MLLNNVSFLLSVLMVCALWGGQAAGDDASQQALGKRLGNLERRAQGTITGEAHCWNLAYEMGEFVEQYRKSGDMAWLDAGVQYYDALVGVMHTSPDGFKGWVGPYIYDTQYYCDAMVTDAILMHHILAFSELILTGDDAALKSKYGEKAQSYVNLAERHLIEKYDSRGTWREDGPYGGYIYDVKFLLPNDLSTVRTIPTANLAGMSQQFNKQMDMAVAALSLYRITGKPLYREKAQKIFAFFKSRLCLFEDQYVWNYWEPFGAWDRDTSDPVKPNTWRHWIAVHPYRNYQAGEIAMIVDAYDTGVVFDRTDLERFCRTNLGMHNGDKKREGPEWLNSNYAVTEAALGTVDLVKAPGGHFPNTAGTLWRPLSRFNADLARLAGEEQAPDWTRKHPERPVDVFDRPFLSSKYLVMAAVMPSVVSNGRPCLVASKSRVPGSIRVELFDAAGEKKLTDIYVGETTGGTDGREGILIQEWTPVNLQAGPYRVRWTVKGEDSREFPIAVR